jgi:hypothetical protein
MTLAPLSQQRSQARNRSCIDPQMSLLSILNNGPRGTPATPCSTTV